MGQIAKSLLFAAKDGRYFMVVCAGDRRISNGKLKRLLGAKTRMARADETQAATGYPPGGVCPFGVEEVEIFIDVSLERYDTVYPAAGTDSSGVPVTFDQLVSITGGTTCNVMQDESQT